MNEVLPASTDSDIAAVRQLFEQYAASLVIDLSFQQFERELASLPGDYSPPRGALFVARADGTAVGCIGLRPFSDSVGEIKRLYIVPAFRGRGLARSLVAAAIVAARRIGYSALVLDTLASMEPAIALYESFGFVRTDAYYANPLPDALYFRASLEPNPWLQVPLAEYEAHMALPSVAQSQLLATTLHCIVTRFHPRSLAILGAAGGNGLELLDAAIVRRVVALDFNPDYLAVCTTRHAASFTEFQPVMHDLSQGPPAIVPVECIFAGLVLEYLRLDVFYSYLPSLLTDGGIFATLLQLPSDGLPVVSVSPFPSLTQLQPAFSFISPTELQNSLAACGFARVADEFYNLDTGKSFLFAAYQLTK